ncbi:hypothetical protein ACQY0O_005442 [Thecaphora frezii]
MLTSTAPSARPSSHHRSRSVHWAPCDVQAAAGPSDRPNTASGSCPPAASPQRRRTISLPLSTFGPPRFFTDLEAHMHTSIIQGSLSSSHHTHHHGHHHSHHHHHPHRHSHPHGPESSADPLRLGALTADEDALAKAQHWPTAEPHAPTVQTSALEVDLGHVETTEPRDELGDGRAPQFRVGAVPLDPLDPWKSAAKAPGGYADSDEAILGRIGESFSRASYDELHFGANWDEAYGGDLEENAQAEQHDDSEEEDDSDDEDGQDEEEDEAGEDSGARMPWDTSYTELGRLGARTSSPRLGRGVPYKSLVQGADCTPPRYADRAQPEVQTLPREWRLDPMSAVVGHTACGGDESCGSDSDWGAAWTSSPSLASSSGGEEGWLSHPTTPDSDHAVLQLAASDGAAGVGKVRVLDLRLCDPDAGERLDVA